ncbi:hypothetical protein ABGB18_43310 [Nonomuraea sp. B12E4]|uniref:hypothetical protein n=1 Tax=Nonomuraea sp. B12E4 TaxID=3153564 RepID=UPI00325F66B3
MEFTGWDAGLALRPRDYLGSGESLADIVKARGPFRGEALHRLALDVAATLARLHMAGIAGLRLDPGNVMIAHNGRAFFTAGPRTSDFPSQDVRDWADVIVFAATGRWQAAEARPDLGGLSPGLRTAIDGCRRRYASARPTAVDLVHRLLGRPGIAHRDTVPELLSEAELRAGTDDSAGGRDRAKPDETLGWGDSARPEDGPGAGHWSPPGDTPITLAPWANDDAPVTLVPISHPSTPVTRKPRSSPSAPVTRKPRSHPSTRMTRGPRSRAEVSATPARLPHGHPLEALAPLPGEDTTAAPPPEDVLIVPAPPPAAPAPVEYEETLVEPAPAWRRPSYFVGVAVGVLIVAVSAGAVTAVSARADTPSQDEHLSQTNGFRANQINPAAGESIGGER